MLRPATHSLSRQNFGRFSSHLLDGPEHPCPATGLEDDLSQGSQASQCSVFEDPNHFRIILDLSQIDETSLNLWIKDHQVTLIADERLQPLSERHEASAFFKCIHLPNDVDEDSIQAELKNARLEIIFKKALNISRNGL
jgi:HSP20 family molecular chaperone IbpA